MEYKATLETLKHEYARRHPRKEAYWVTRDGQKVYVTEMSDEHLERTIQMLEKLEWAHQKKRELQQWEELMNMDFNDIINLI